MKSERKKYQISTGTLCAVKWNTVEVYAAIEDGLAALWPYLVSYVLSAFRIYINRNKSFDFRSTGAS